MKKIKNLLLILTCCTLMLTGIYNYGNYPIIPTGHLNNITDPQ